MKRSIVLAVLMVLPTMAPTRPSPSWSRPAQRGDQMMRDVVLSSHNEARRQFGAAPLAWSEALAAEALRHAQYMASTGIYGHDRTPGRRKKMGENIWRGQRGLFSYDVMVGVMVGEQRNFRAGAYPNNSRTGDWSNVSHFTQIIWPTTTEVGCALASSPSTDYFVCRYAPAGNKEGVYLAPGRVAELPAARRSAQGGD